MSRLRYILRRLAGFRVEPGMPGYHDLHITTPGIPRTSIFNLPYGIEVSCTRVTGWQAWDIRDPREKSVLLGGEYDGEKWLVLDVNGHVIVSSRDREDGDE